MRGGDGGAAGVSANEYKCAHGAQKNFGDLTSYFTYAHPPTHPARPFLPSKQSTSPLAPPPPPATILLSTYRNAATTSLLPPPLQPSTRR